MHGCDGHEAPYKNCEIHDPGSGFQALRLGQYGQIENIYYISKNLLYFHILRKTGCIAIMSIKPFT